MDWKIFMTTFLTTLISEMGDKTQIATMSISSQTKSTGSVIAGAILGLCIAATFGILVGRFLGNALNPQVVRIGSAVLFIGIGLWVLFVKPL
jgi:putative Ca2+/H+ antiporter (TMEM165/GDT1 family)